jgi:hypothetical protein
MIQSPPLPFPLDKTLEHPYSVSHQEIRDLRAKHHPKLPRLMHLAECLQYFSVMDLHYLFIRGLARVKTDTSAPADPAHKMLFITVNVAVPIYDDDITEYRGRDSGE